MIISSEPAAAMHRCIACKQGFMKSAKIIAFARNVQRRDKHELAFLPAGLEIVETPASPIGRTIGAVIIALFCLALVWASFGKIDIVALAPGKIVATGRTKTIQPFETGVIRAIHIQDGQGVKAGDALIELDPTINEAERDHLRGDLISAELDGARLQAMLTEGANPLDVFRPPSDANADLVATQKDFLLAQMNEHRSKLGALDSQMRQKAAERATIAASIEKLQGIIPIVQQRVDIRKILYDHQTGSKITYLENLETLVDNQKELEVQKSRLIEAEAALNAITQTRAQTEAEFRRALFGELTEADRKVAGLTRDVAKINERTRLQVLTAPVDGVVQQLAVHTVGGVVTPAQALLSVVPSEGAIEIEAKVSNRDIGFIHAGQDVEVKVDTFNFTRYGLLHGRVLGVSRDSIVRENPQDKSNGAAPGPEANSSEPSGQELYYQARISLDRTDMQIDDNLVKLSPGMAVTAEIKTGARRIISYLLSPLIRYRHESMRER
jgi:hemolysin D